jgi:hypothetical protein
MKTALKVLSGLMLICAVPGCCCCDGRGYDNCQTAPWLGANSVATTPNVEMGWPAVPTATTLAGTTTPPERAMR